MLISLCTCDYEAAHLYIEPKATELAADGCTARSGAAAQHVRIIVVTTDIPHLPIHRQYLTIVNQHSEACCRLYVY